MKAFCMWLLAVVIVFNNANGPVLRSSIKRSAQPNVRPQIKEMPLDKSGTTKGREKTAGSQVIVNSALANPVSLQAEGIV